MNELFTNLAHELLTPLTILTASIDHTLGNSARHKDDYYTMILNIQRMQHLLQQILETSKQQSGNLKLLVANGDVMAHIRTTSRAVEPLMQKKGIDYCIQCTPSTMRGWIDTDKIDKIIFNLLSNAAKYTPANGKVWLTATTNKRFDKIYIEVKDTGAGMNSHQLKHLYEHFYDGDYRKHHTTGNGLGLAITRDLVSLHNGKIECESHEGVGTTFLVTLPINKEAYKKEQIDEINPISMATPEVAFIDNANMPQPTDSTTDADEQASEDAYKILVVDDNTELLYMLKRLLSATYHVRVALNGMEALEHVANHTFDLVISDVMMPKIDGYELTRRLKANTETCHLPIILLTACTQAESHEEALKAGADDYVTKPFTPMELLARVNSQLRRYRRFAEKLNKQNEGKNIHVVGGLELNEDTVEVTVDGEPVKLTPIEYKILLLLMKNPGRVFSSEEIYERVWNERAINTDTIMVHVRNIREKIESCPKEPKYLKVVWGVGYKIEKQA